jgi:hypothetical protein
MHDLNLGRGEPMATRARPAFVAHDFAIGEIAPPSHPPGFSVSAADRSRVLSSRSLPAVLRGRDTPMMEGVIGV